MLGELLCEAGLLSAQDLNKALSAQLICGGKIGTSLIELEMVAIDQVSRHLAAQLGLPEATPPILEQASQEALSLIPRELCSRYKVLPLMVQDRLLHVAMLDPMDLAQVDELSFVTGLRVQPMVAPELRLYYLLERHFGLERPSRYLRVPGGDAVELSSGQPQRRRYLMPLEVDVDMEMDEDEDLELELPEEYTDARPAPPAEDDLGLVYLDSFTDVPVTSAPAAPAQSPLERALARLEQARNQQDVASALVLPVAGGTVLSVLFVVRGQALIGVAAHGTASTAEEVGELVLSLTPRSMLREAFRQRAVLRGPGQDPFMHLVASYLGAPAPAEACVAPIFAGEQEVVQLLCTLSANSPLEAVAADVLHRLCASATDRYARLLSRLE